MGEELAGLERLLRMRHMNQSVSSMSSLSNLSHQPYSNKAGLCIIKSKEGNLFLGIRIESASFPTTISAVQAGVVQCLMHGQQPAIVFYQDPTISGLDYWVSLFFLKTEQLSEKTFHNKVVKLQKTYQQKLEATNHKHSYAVKSSQVKGITSLEPISLEFFGLTKFSEEAYNLENTATTSSPVFKRDQMEQFKQTLVNVCQHAICTESNFPVGALLWTNLGIFPGVNVEFDDWSLGLCAERTALISALSHGAKTFYGIFVHAINGDLSTPCGACRQILSEHMLYSKLYSLHKDYTWSEYFVHDLLPNAFFTDSLAKF